MIQGIVTSEREIVVPLVVHATAGAVDTVHAIVDTGFTGLLVLPERLIEKLDLGYSGRASATLADGSRVVLRRYDAMIDWLGTELEVPVLAADGGPLIGMALLGGNRMSVDVVEGGSVTIASLSMA